jgi:hypothetical protein
MRAIRGDTVMQGAIELLAGPSADAGIPVGRDVGGIDRAERGVKGQTAGKSRAMGLGVAAGAVA